MHKAQSFINHVAVVTDASYSMRGLESTVRKVLDEQIRTLDALSKEHNQETRVSVYRFGEQTIECLIFDMDVARLPSSKELYSVLRENTSLVDAFLKSQDDLSTTSTLYGDHAFLTFLLTDGQENRSKNPKSAMAKRIFAAPENWSVGFLVPDRAGVREMENLGVLADSVAIWDVTSAKGLIDAGTKMRDATSNWMAGRKSGVRGTKSVFGTGVEKVNTKTVTKTLKPLKLNEYSLHAVRSKERIDDFVDSVSPNGYVRGNAFYQLNKSEIIQPQKKVIVLDKNTGQAYAGTEARHLIGLPDDERVRVRPDANPLYDIFVQSTSLNRNLVPNTRVLVLK